MGDSLLNTQDGNLIHLKKEWGSLQDLDTDGKQVYAFMDSGIVAVFRKINWPIPLLPILYQKSSATEVPRSPFRHRADSFTRSEPDVMKRTRQMPPSFCI